MMASAPAAAARALSLGQPSRGAMRRSLVRPKLAMARAAKPIFSPSCGSTRITAGAKPGCLGVASDLGIARDFVLFRPAASALAFIIGTRCNRGEPAAMATANREQEAFKYPAGDFQ